MDKDNSITEEAQPESNWEYSSDNNDSYGGEAVGSQTDTVVNKEVNPIEWEASEYIVHEKSSSWYTSLGIGTAVLTLAVYLVSSREILPAIVVLVACISVGFYAGRKPSTKQYSVDSRGIHIEKNFHSYREFKSFSIVEEGAIDSIWLAPLKRFAPLVVIYFSPEDEEKIVNVLANYLPQERRELDAIDKFSKRMKF